MARILRYGMVGGGPGALVGDGHRKAILLDGKADLVCGVFSQNPEKSRAMGEKLRLDPARCYDNFEEMAKQEAAREDGIDFVVIVTPNNSHFAICKAFLNAGIHVVCDKPVTVSYAQAQELRELAKAKGLLFMVTYTYTGYVTVKYARELVRRGELGDIRMVMAEYPQSWLADGDAPLSKQGLWRCNPELSGGVNCLGDIGTHVQNMVSTITGLKIRRVLARLDKLVPGRVLDDNDSVMIEYDNGASGLYWSSQIARGSDNGLRVRIYGSKGTILWFQEEHEKITFIDAEGTIREVHRGHKVMGEKPLHYARLGAGHSEGWIAALGNLYSSYIDCLNAWLDGSFTEDMIDYPTIDAGAESLAYVEACLQSTNNGNVWVTL